MTVFTLISVAWGLFFVALGTRMVLRREGLSAGFKTALEWVLFGSIIGALLLFAAAPVFLFLS